MNARAAVSVLLLAAQLACLAPMRPVELDHVRSGPRRVWVTRHDGSRVEVYQPQIVFDTLFTGWGPDGATFIGFPVSEIRTVTTRAPGTGRTLLVLGLVVGVGLFAVISSAGHAPDPQIIEEDFAPRLPPRAP